MNDEEEKQPAGNDSQKRDKFEMPEIVEQTNLAAERMEQATKRREEVIAREEDLEARRKLGGTTEAGAEKPKEKTEDETWAKEAKERYEGTGLDPTPDDTPTTFA